jgi:predicted nucleic acid-binding protein
MILCDTNILIEFYKGNSEIVTELQSVGIAELAVSVVTCGELILAQRTSGN